VTAVVPPIAGDPELEELLVVVVVVVVVAWEVLLELEAAVSPPVLVVAPPPPPPPAPPASEDVVDEVVEECSLPVAAHAPASRAAPNAAKNRYFMITSRRKDERAYCTL
jgi:hypothetical protein